jgi:ATP phosphoribosyltransferase regulatory subunit
VPVDAARLEAVHAALATKDAAELGSVARDFPADTRKGLEALLSLYGDASILDEARRVLPERASIAMALDELKQLAAHASQAHPEIRIGFDLADSSGYAYYSGARFAVYVDGASDAIARGGRYDEVGAIFGRTRPAVGFGLDVKELVDLAPATAPKKAIRAPWSDDASLRSAVRQLRKRGEVVVRQFPGDPDDEAGVDFDRTIVSSQGHWSLQDGAGA